MIVVDIGNEYFEGDVDKMIVDMYACAQNSFSRKEKQIEEVEPEEKKKQRLRNHPVAESKKRKRVLVFVDDRPKRKSIARVVRRFTNH